MGVLNPCASQSLSLLIDFTLKSDAGNQACLGSV